MVADMKTTHQKRIAKLIKSAKSGTEALSKLEPLRKLKGDWFQNDPVLVSEFLPCLFELQPDDYSPVRQLVTLLIGDIGLKHMDVLPEVVPMLTVALEDSTPAVARQALRCGIGLFRCIFEKVAIQGLFSSDLDDSLESAWAWMLKFKEKICSMAFQPGKDSTRLLALKFVEVIILLYTPDPNGSPEPPSDQVFEGNAVEFNISWLRGGHPLLNAGDLAIEATQNLGLLLDQLRLPAVKSLSNSAIIVLIKSLAAIAVKRPAFYGRILPVLLGLDPCSAKIKGFHITAARYALKNAYMSCLDCTHPGAAPWRERLNGALRELKDGNVTEGPLHQLSMANDSLEDRKIDLFGKEEKPHISTGKKRQGVEDKKNMQEGDDQSGKRRKATSSSEDLLIEPKRELSDSPSAETSSKEDNTNPGPVHQLIVMFRELVAQGERAAGSLDILMSSISADLMAEMVMVNMRNLPHSVHETEFEEELHQNTTLNANTCCRKHPSSLAAEISELVNSIPQIASLLDAKQPVNNEDEELPTVADLNDPLAEVRREANVISPVDLQESPVIDHMVGIESSTEPTVTAITSLKNEIPGLDNYGAALGVRESDTLSSFALICPDQASQDQGLSLDGKSTSNLLPSISDDQSEELSSKSAATDANSLTLSTASSVRLPSQIIIPKLSAPVVNITDEQKDFIQQCAFTRIVEVYKEMVVAGGIDVRLSLLAYLGTEFPLELDPWKVLREHILTNYSNHGGHELTLRVLYRLFGEAEVENDFFSSTTATSVYETFIQTVVETLRDDFPATDKSLNRLLGEVPYIPRSVFGILECLCCPGNDEKETMSGDRVTQGLSTIWSLILMRPPIRDACLKIALQSAVHQSEEVHMKAIRLVANKLYQLPYVSQQIEEFALNSLLSVVSGADNAERSGVGKIKNMEKESESENPIIEHPSVSPINRTTTECISSSSEYEASRCMALYFALCTKKHTLLRQLFFVYRTLPKAAKQVVQSRIPILIRTVRASSELLEIISDPPTGSEDLLMQVFHTLKESVGPSPELISTLKTLYDTKLKNVEILIPFLPSLQKEEVLRIFPRIVDLPIDKFRATLSRLLQESSSSGPIMDPPEVLIAIHGIDPDRDGIPLKKVTDACNVCFDQRLTFTQQVVAKALNQLVEQIPLPLLFMRTVLQAMGAFPDLVEFVMEILSRLVSKQIWKYPKLWVGFLKCASVTKPQSFPLLLQLPPAQLEIALNRTPALREPLVAFASQPNIKSTLPRSVLVVLGLARALAPEPQTSNQTPQPKPHSQIQYQTQPQLQTEEHNQSYSQTEKHNQSHSQTKEHNQSLSQTEEHSQSHSQTEERSQSQAQSPSQSEVQSPAEAPTRSQSPWQQAQSETDTQSHQTEVQSESEEQSQSQAQSGTQVRTPSETPPTETIDTEQEVESKETETTTETSS